MARITPLSDGTYDVRGSAQHNGGIGGWNAYRGIARSAAEAQRMAEAAEEAIVDPNLAPPAGVKFAYRAEEWSNGYWSDEGYWVTDYGLD